MLSPTKNIRKIAKSITRFNGKPDMENVADETPNGITPLTISSGSKPASKVTSCGNNKGLAKPNDLKTTYSNHSSDLRYVQKDDNVAQRVTRGRSLSKGRNQNKSPVIKNRSKNRRQSKSPTHVRASSPTKQVR
jgi:hypothetical protein